VTSWYEFGCVFFQDLERNLELSKRLFEGIMGLLGPYQQAASAQKVDKLVNLNPRTANVVAILLPL